MLKTFLLELTVFFFNPAHTKLFLNTAYHNSSNLRIQTLGAHWSALQTNAAFVFVVHSPHSCFMFGVLRRSRSCVFVCVESHAPELMSWQLVVLQIFLHCYSDINKINIHTECGIQTIKNKTATN